MEKCRHNYGKQFREALALEKPLQIVGVINAYAAMMAESTGFKALYLSGAGVANACYGIPDVGITTLEDVLEEARRILKCIHVPLLVDIDTGFGSLAMTAKAIHLLEDAGVAAIHIEDQRFEKKRCGHREGKEVVTSSEMAERIKTAANARRDPSFVIMARTDAFAVEGLESTIGRCLEYEAAGADMHFIEALCTLDQYKKCVKTLSKPVLANITEFGKTPLFTRDELASVGVSMILYPLSAWRAMNLAALKVYHDLKEKGTQRDLLEQMQTREELYGFLKY